MSHTDERAITRLSRIIQLPTVSATINERESAAAFAALFDELPQLYPTIWSTAEIDAVPPCSLTVSLPGEDPALEPLLLLAHFDVVDVPHATRPQWEYPPFSGHVDDAFVWGRGAIDDKSVFVALLEALERTMDEGRRMRRGVVLAFGGDEELSGLRGAGAIAQKFADEGRRFVAVVDEGGVIASGMLRTPSAPVALLGVAEKGFCNIRVEATADGGHASMPPRGTALGAVAKAVVRIERSPFPPRLLPAIRRFFGSLAPHAGLPIRLLFANVRALWAVVARVLGGSPSTDALIRTTQAVTMATGSQAANVLPQLSSVTVNCRILPGESVQSVLEHYRRLLKHLPVTVTLAPDGEHSEPVAETPIDHPTYRLIERLVSEQFPEAIPAPYLVTGSTDSKWYRSLSDAIIRFVPITLRPEDLARVHGMNERISKQSYLGLIRFYERLIEEECCHG